MSQDRLETTDACVTFIHSCQRKGTYRALKHAFISYRDHYDGPDERELGFSWPLSDYDGLEGELRRMMERVVEFWKNIGGWAKLVS